MFARDLTRYGGIWDPWREMRRARNRVNRFLDDVGQWSEHGYPALNVWTSGDDVMLTAELPGIEAKDVDVSVHDTTLTVRGERKAERLEQGQAYHRQERGSGKFVRTVELPFTVDTDAVDARLEKGVLHLRLSRAERDKPRKIEIKTN